jgi:hypothetical protein
MKIAISFSGQPHTYDECLKTFEDNCKFDSFSHFWWDKSYLNQCFKMHYNMKMQDETIVNKVKKIFGHIKCVTEPCQTFDLSFIKYFNHNTWQNVSLNYYRMMTPIFLYGYLSQIESINKAIQLVDIANYDVIIRSRPDVIYTKNIRSIVNKLSFSSDTIFIQKSNGGHLYAGEPQDQPCDWFYMGNSQAMNTFVQGIKNGIKNYFQNGIIHIRDFLKLVAKDNGLKLILIDFGSVIYKQTHLFDDQYKNNIDIYMNDFDKETCSVKTPELWPYWIKNVDFKYFKDII